MNKFHTYQSLVAATDMREEVWEGKDYLVGNVFITGMGMAKVNIDLNEMKIVAFEKKSSRVTLADTGEVVDVEMMAIGNRA